MTNITRDQAQSIIRNAPQGTDPRAVLDELVKRGHTIEGVDMGQARTRVASQMTDQEVKQKQSFRERTASVLDSVFGGGTIGSAIGRSFARSRVDKMVKEGQMFSPEQQRFIEESFKKRTGKDIDVSPEATAKQIKESIKGPSFKEIAGDVARVGATFIPVGRATTAGAKLLQGVGIKKGAQFVSSVLAGGAAGAAIDITEDIKNGRDVGLGYATLFGAGIPATTPVVKALGRATTRLAGKFGSEVSGALTGTSAETVEQAFNAAKKGGKELDSFTNALRGKTTPERLAQTLRDNTQIINTQRQTLFKETLSELGEEVVDTQPAKDKFFSMLDDAKIFLNEDGTLNFAKAGKLKLVPQAQTKIQQAFAEVADLPPRATLVEVDDARQAIKALSLTGDDASANLGNKLIDDAVRSVRTAGEQVQGYGQMLDEFAETSQFLDDLQKGLAATDQRTIDQTYRRMATALKTNNEQRMALVRELDRVTDGAILSQISGQQLSEAMPRGIFRQIAAGMAGGALLTGGLSQSMIPALVLASPRATGEFVRALGLTAKQTDLLIKSISQARFALVKAGIIGAAVVEDDSQ